MIPGQGGKVHDEPGICYNTRKQWHNQRMIGTSKVTQKPTPRASPRQKGDI